MANRNLSNVQINVGFNEASTRTNINSGESINTLFGKIKKWFTDLEAHIANTSNPHSVTKTQVGLGNVDNTSDLNKPISNATQTALNGKAASSHTHTSSQITDRIDNCSIGALGWVSTANDDKLITSNTLAYWNGAQVGVTSNLAYCNKGAFGDMATKSSSAYLPVTGGTITGGLLVDSVLQNGNQFNNVVRTIISGRPKEILIKTKIPFLNSNAMPIVHIKGYAYGIKVPIELNIVFYILHDAFTSYSCTTLSEWKPTIKLFSYTENSTKYVGIALIYTDGIYYPLFVVDFLDIWRVIRNYSSGWVITSNDTTTSIVPDTDLVTVPYEPIANDISGNADTATALTTNAGSVTQPIYFANGKPVATTYSLAKSVPSNAVFTDTVYTHPNSGVTAGTYRSVTVNEQGHITSGANPTITISQGGTGATSAASALSNLGLTATATELNYCDGVRSNIQTQLDNLNSSYQIQYGVCTAPTEGYSATGYNITFETPFTNVPVITGTCCNEHVYNNAILTFTFANITTTGFTIFCNSGRTIGWIAIADV